MAQGALQLLGEQVMGKLGAGKKPSGSSSGGKSGGGKGGGASQVVTLNSADFKSKVMESKDDWLIAFTAPWCGHCVKLQPEWEDAAKQLKGDFKLGWVDATQESGLAQQYQVQGYPTIKLFSLKDGKKVASEYNGGRDAAGIVNFCHAHISATGSAKPLTEITSAAVFADECSDDLVGICVLGFLPSILDDQSAKRNARLEQLMTARKKVGRTFRFMWLAGGENYELEEKLGLGFGYPALVAISPSKKRFSVMKGKFEAGEIESFLNGVVRGKEQTAEIKTWPMKFVKVPAWDGKDAAPPVDDVELD
jgi:protein disulfide-isomerase A6